MFLDLGCACTPDCPPVGGTQGPPGPMGSQGYPGPQGLDGQNAFGLTTAPFTMPPIGANVSVLVDTAEWATQGQFVYIGGPAGEVGYFQVAVTSTLSKMVLTNMGYDENLAPGMSVGSGMQVSPAGIRGPQGPAWVLLQPLGINLGGTGQSTAAAAFTALSPLTGKGQIIACDGQQDVAVVSAADGQVLITDSTTTAGMRWIDSQLLQVSFDAISPLEVKGDLLVYDGAINRRLPVGALANMVLTVVPNSEAGVDWAAHVGFGFTRVSYARTPVVLDGTEQLVGISTPNVQAPVTVVLATADHWTNNLLCIKDELGTADLFPITLTTSDGSLIQNQTSYTLDIPFGHVFVYSNSRQFFVL